jgi:cytochrome c oxidase subunit 2
VVPNPSARTGLLGRAVRLALAAGLVTVTLAGCSTEEVLRFGWPKGVTPQAEAMRELWTWSVVAALVVGVGVWGLMFWCIVRYRKKSEELPVQTRFNLPLEVLYTVAPVLIVSVLFYYTAITQVYVDKQLEKPDVTISVIGFKWNWIFAYPDATGPDGRAVQTVGSSDEIPILVLPTGKRIRFQESSNDVIHSFWVPEMLFKRDVVPGRTNSFEISRIDREGAYVGRCAELCGTYHSNMNFEVRAVSPEDYEKYMDARKKGDTAAEALTAIGQEPRATTTVPFDTRRQAANR